MAASSVVSDLAVGDLKYFLSKFTEGEKVWVKGTKETVWDLGEVIAAFSKSDDDTVAVRTENGRDVVTSKVYGGESIAVQDNPSGRKRVGYQDMTAMRFVNEPQILENLRQRALYDQPYTFLGPVLVAVNPLKRIEALSEKNLKPGEAKVMGLSHPYAVAELAYQQMLFALRRPGESAESPMNQTVIVSGESGAGKTVSSKLVINHLVARSGGGDLAKAMIGSNPITESFGNAKTLRNPNSSRFGKMFRVLYDKKGEAIIGATVGTYLLERSRITSHELGERNYHIFYELLKCGDDALLADLKLEKDGKYKALLPHTKVESQKEVHFLDVDKENFDAVATALQHVGVESDRFADLMKAVSSVLHLSNVEFDELNISGNDASKVSDASRKHLEAAAELLSVSADHMESVFTELERKVGAQVIKSPVSAVHAQQLLEGVAKALYSRIFSYMVHIVNLYVNKSGGDESLPSIGVLDIFGFETFVKNDLEQLLINYTNEALQLTFNKQVLEAEAALYKRENLAMSETDKAALDPSQVIDQSNKFCIDLLQGVTLDVPGKKKKKKKHVHGILDVIHEQGRVPGPSEKKMLEKLHQTFAGKQMYPNYKIMKKKARTEFIVKHYAGKVTYTTGNFLLKNVDSLPKTANDLFMSSTKEMTKQIWDSIAKGHGMSRSKKDSIVSFFKKQITDLNNDLNATTASFIRCIKPNAEMHRNEGWFNKRYITVQLRNLSIPKTADVLKAGLPTRIPYDQLVEGYRTIFGDKVRTPDLDNERGLKSFIAALFFAFEIPRTSYKLGLTKVFFKSGDLDKLDEVLASADNWAQGNLDATAEAERDRIIERYKRYHVQRRWKVLLAAMFAGQMFKKLYLAQKQQKERELNAAILLQKQLRMFVARKKYASMLYAKKLEEERIAKEKAEAERKEQERLAEEARRKELEKQKQLKLFLAERRERERKQKQKFAKMLADLKKANDVAADQRQKEVELKKKERERREEEERQKQEEAEKQRQELEQLRIEREAEIKRLAEVAEVERKAKQAYEEKLQIERMKKEQEAAAAAKAKASKTTPTKAEAEAQDLVSSKEYMDYIGEKLKRDQEKLEEKHVMEQVVDELLAREEHKELLEFEEDDDDDDVLDNENPWFFYEDLDLDEIDNISHSSQDEERINEALRFLDNLVDDDSEDDSEDSETESIDGEDYKFAIAQKTDQAVTQANFKDYNGPFIVNVNLNKLDENALKKKKMGFMRKGLQAWKQCFAFVYPAHQRVLLHHGTDTTIKVQFNPKTSAYAAMLKKSAVYNRKKNVIYVTGVRLMEKDDDKASISRHLIMSFHDSAKRNQFADLINHFVAKEGEAPSAPVASKQGKSKVAISPRTFNVPSKMPNRRQVLMKENFTKFALLNQAVKTGKLKKERVHDILLETTGEDEEDYDNFSSALKSCVKCSQAVSSSNATCPHCGALQAVS